MTKRCILISSIALMMSFSLPAYHVWILEPELIDQIEQRIIHPAQHLMLEDRRPDMAWLDGINQGQQQLSESLTSSSWLIGSATSGYFVAQLLLLFWVRLSCKKRDAAEKRMEQIAFFDPLTQKPNRNKFQQDLTMTLNSHDDVGILVIDLARFKLFNDILGYEIGDMILREMSRRIQATLLSTETLYRLGADSFGIIIPNFIHPNRLTLLASEILRKIRAPLPLTTSAEVSRKLTITAHIGIAVSTRTSPYDAQNLHRNAQVALALSVEKGGNHFHLFTSDMRRAMEQRIELEEQLHRALRNGEFVLHYQPQLNLRSHTLCGMEALVRWQHPEHGLTYPDSFIKVAEQSDLISELGKWVLETACRQGEQWRRRYFDLTMAVNISSQQFAQCDFIQTVDQALYDTQFPPRLLKLELTETTMLESNDQTVGKLQALKQRGIQLSIDDFGTGYSSLSYLKNFPIDQIKIDRSFITHLRDKKRDATLVETILTIGRKLGIECIAEGVETEEQRTFLARKGCQQIQGYLIGRPEEAALIDQRLEQEPMTFAKREKNYFLMHVAG